MTEETQITEGNFRNMSYGLLWWIIDAKKGIYAAVGNSGNVIYIIKLINLFVGLQDILNPKYLIE